MKSIGTVREAKDFLADRIVAEARREGAPLSEIERKMLYFSKTGWTLPDMKAVSAEFDRGYDQEDYEQKIAGLVAGIAADHHHRNEDEEEKWDAAVHKLSDGDHYLSVLVGPSQSNSTSRKNRPPHDILKLWLTAFAVILAIWALMALADRFFASRLWLATGWDLGDRDKSFLVILIFAAIYFLGRKAWWAIRLRSQPPRS
jgi:hypothetical protein